MLQPQHKRTIHLSGTRTRHSLNKPCCRTCSALWERRSWQSWSTGCVEASAMSIQSPQYATVTAERYDWQRPDETHCRLATNTTHFDTVTNNGYIHWTVYWL